jgi:hypothetical protein
VTIVIVPGPGTVVLGLPPDAPDRRSIAAASLEFAVLLGLLGSAVLLGLLVAHYSGSSPRRDSAAEKSTPLSTTGTPAPASAVTTSTLPAVDFSDPGLRYLQYVSAAGWYPGVTLFSDDPVDQDQLAERLGLPITRRDAVGPVWGIIAHPAAGLARAATAFVEVANLEGLSCTEALSGAIGRDLDPRRHKGATELTGLPAGWRGVHIPDARRPESFFYGCTAGTVVSAEIQRGLSQQDPVPEATQLAAAIAHRGIPRFRSDIDPQPTPKATSRPTGKARSR